MANWKIAYEHLTRVMAEEAKVFVDLYSKKSKDELVELLVRKKLEFYVDKVYADLNEFKYYHDRDDGLFVADWCTTVPLFRVPDEATQLGYRRTPMFDWDEDELDGFVEHPAEFFELLQDIDYDKVLEIAMSYQTEDKVKSD